MAEKKQSFWSTLPGLITGIAAIVTGLAALVPIILGVTGKSTSKHAGSTPAATQSASPGASGSAGSATGESPSSGAAVPGSSESPGGPGELVASPTKVDWGRVGTSSSPQQRTVTFTNQGSGPVTVDGDVAITGPNAGAFSISGTSCGNGRALASGDSCTVNVTYTPALGTQTATLTVPYHATSLKVALAANGVLL